MSAYELGYGVGSVVITAVGALLIYKGYSTWNASSGRTATQTAPARNVIPAAPTQAPATATAIQTAPADDFFFGATLRPATPSRPTTGPPTIGPPVGSPAAGPNPAIADTRWHADYSSTGSGSGSTASKNSTGLIIVAVGLLVVGVGLFQTYQSFLAPSRGIEFPDQLIGMERNETVAELLDQAQGQMASAPGIIGEVELEGAAYISGERVLYVVGGEQGATDPAEYDKFSADFEQAFTASGTGLTLTEIEAGSLGGKMWCSGAPVEGASVCAWLDEETFGLMVLSAEGADVSDSAVEIREAVVN